MDRELRDTNQIIKEDYTDAKSIAKSVNNKKRKDIYIYIYHESRFVKNNTSLFSLGIQRKIGI